MLPSAILMLAALCLASAKAQHTDSNHLPDQSNSFPGVSRDVASFCTGRPSFPIDLATMVVHTKKNVSFNYKLYLFSADNVIQTGQVIPRDDFKIHGFPVKLKRLPEFWPANVPTYRVHEDENNSTSELLRQVPSNQFSLERFLHPVALHQLAPDTVNNQNERAARHQKLLPPDDAHGDILPGDPPLNVTSNYDGYLNRNVDFDQEDNVTASQLNPLHNQETRNMTHGGRSSRSISSSAHDSETVVPVGSFSSFQVNLTYLVRKDFGQVDPEVVMIHIDPAQFLVTKVILMNATSRQAANSISDLRFLSHKILRDPNTRITGINQIYEDWITRNFYTLVYIQRRSIPVTSSNDNNQNLITDRLIFRGSGPNLVGADQLDYNVKATAFITEKNGLHYYLEFINSDKFYLCAIDWTKRPFRFLDSRQMPIKATKTLMDNEELLLCPPAICYSDRPIDEIVAYGRLPDASNSTDDSKPRSHINIRLHLRDWVWDLTLGQNSKELPGRHKYKRSIHQTAGPTFGWRYELAKRNDIKIKHDNYGYALTGHELDASFRINNELYIISANQLVTINYTLSNETVISSQKLSNEFHDLTSPLSNPITGAFYDKFNQHLFFFKGAHYVGYDYRTRKPLTNFVQENQLIAQQVSNMSSYFDPIVISLPVSSILGSQLEVDGVFQDPLSDIVHVFSGMKFLTFKATDFKDGSFRPDSQSLQQMFCINKKFLSSCKFDRAFVNPCSDDLDDEFGRVAEMSDNPNRKLIKDLENFDASTQAPDVVTVSHESNGFHEEQQTRLRLLARTPKLLRFLDSSRENSSDQMSQFTVLSNKPLTNRNLLAEDRVIRFLLITVGMLIISLSLAFVLLIVVWKRNKRTANKRFIAALARAQSNGLFLKTNYEHGQLPTFEQMTSKI